MPNVVQPPSRLQPDTPLKDNLAYLNNNFDNIVTAVNDIGVKNYGTADAGAINLIAGAFHFIAVNIVDVKDQYVLDNIAITPRLQIFVDNDNDYNYLYPSGASMTTPLQSLSVEWYQARVVPTGSPANTKAVVYFKIQNNDTSAHTYYVTADFYFGDSPTTGIFR